MMMESEEGKEAILFLDGLRKRLIYFKDVKNSVHSAIRHDICAIELAINYLELKIIRNREIKREELKWFNGRRYIEDTFGNDSEFKDIYVDYLKICELLERFV